ncbi:MAG: LPS-assembly protein LptD, partial [Chryseobacterium sp.]
PITITGTSSYSQNFSTGLGDLKLPVLNVAINQFYLFKPATGVRQGLLENITVNTGLNLNNYVQTNEGELFTKAMFDKMQTGLKNNIGLGTNTTIAKYFTFSINANIDNALTTKTLTRTYNPVTNLVDEIYNKEIAGFSSFSTGASLQTVLYGQKNFKKDSKIVAIRHMMTPQIGFNYSPDFSAENFGYYTKFSNSRGELTQYSIFDNGIVGTPNSGLVQSLSIAINNNLEMKVRSKKDSTGVKKIKIFESLNFTTNYNFAAPQYKWSIFNFTGQTNLFDKLNLNTSLALEPYQIIFAPGSDEGIRTENFGRFSVQGFNAQLSYPLNNETFNGKEKPDLSKKYNKKGEIRNENYFFDDDNYARFTQPWTLNINAQGKKK